MTGSRLTKFFEIEPDFSLVRFTLEDGFSIHEEQVKKASKITGTELIDYEIVASVSHISDGNGNIPELRYFIISPTLKYVLDYCLSDRRRINRGFINIVLKV